MKTPLMRTAVLFAGALVTLTACGSGDSDDVESDSKIRVVASTDVYGDIASRIGGSDVEVESFLTQPGQDPHSFDVRPKNALIISKADLVIENGGGYDEYMGQLLEASDSKPALINAVEVSGKTPSAGEELNEHVWYDLPSMQKLADAIASDLGKLDTAKTGDFASRAEEFKAEIQELIVQEGEIKADETGTSIAITEPVPLYLTEASGLVNKTPEEFAEAIEEGTDVPASVLDDTLKLFEGDAVQALLYNEQTSGPITEQVRAAAEKADVAVVPVTETLPTGLDYVGWMRKNLDDLAAALGQE